MKRFAILLPLLCCVFFVTAQQLVQHDLHGSWDTVTVLKNPHKGWYVHYYDNGLERYGASLKPGDLLDDFPGLHHIYLRLAWSFLEPQEGKFNWMVLDSIINRWTEKGYKITFRITCKETAPNQVFATPEWVLKSGAKGAFVGHNKNWEPDYGDPVFLQKLETFHKAFAGRYDGKPYVEYIDIGSYGDWGEGHNVFGSKKDYSFEVIKKHFEIYKRCYKKSLLMVSDDIITSRAVKDNVGEQLFQYVIASGISVRDDSVSVKWFADNYGFSTLRSVFIFDSIWRRLPVDLELEHYQATLDQNTWRGGGPFEAAIHEAHATYIGFHGEPRKWLSENGDFAKRMANKAGYWYFVRGASLPEVAKPGETITVKMAWENKGVAPAYHKYKLQLQVKCGAVNWVQDLKGSDNRKWMPDSVVEETYSITLPQNILEGLAQVAVKLLNDDRIKEPVQIGLKWKTGEGFYQVGKVAIESGKKTGKRKVVLFGDSITEGAFEPGGYADVLRKTYLKSSAYQLIGAGIGGNRVIDLARRVDDHVLRYKPSKVVLFVGVNDCGWHKWHPEDEQVTVGRYEQELVQLVKRLQVAGIKVVLCSPALIGEKKNGANYLDNELDKYVAACKSVAKQTGTSFVNVRKACLDYLEQHNTENREKGILTTDGVHLTALGSRLVAKEISKALQ